MKYDICIILNRATLFRSQYGFAGYFPPVKPYGSQYERDGGTCNYQTRWLSFVN
jgi:hypothetical protein